jgi:hypothetical protein
MKKFYLFVFLNLFLTAPLIAGLMTDTTGTGNIDSSSYTDNKICVCQLFNVKEDKTDKLANQLVGFFAEKNLDGKAKYAYRLLDEYIRREKIYYEIVFVKSAAFKERIFAPMDCISLYKKLKLQNDRLRLYNIIEVDALKELAKR